MTAFNQAHFLDHLINSLRSLGVQMTHTSEGLKNTIERAERNPKECYTVTLFGHTPDYCGPQPAYKFMAFAYPAERKLFVNGNEGNGDWWEILFSQYDNRTPIEYTLKSHGLNYEGADWQVIFD